ncbi:hypothetical protein [Cupriavidus basilensis]|uniref:hypothetical protein n=1 Tax=Cupriavidus basilensis TaxID=68895 RepID=UPI0039F6CB25
MLSESVLEELLRETPMREHLVREAWPDLSTESRLQISQAFDVGWMAGVPDWLSLLALNDTAVIVRYWAARLTHFQPPRPEGVDDVLGPLSERTEEQKQLYEMARTDSSELVRLCADCGETLTYQTLATVSQLQRLAFLRTLSMPHLGVFFQWLDTAVRAGVPDLELRECLREFVSLPAVREDLEPTPMNTSMMLWWRSAPALPSRAVGMSRELRGERCRGSWHISCRPAWAWQRSLPTS